MWVAVGQQVSDKAASSLSSRMLLPVGVWQGGSDPPRAGPAMTLVTGGPRPAQNSARAQRDPSLALILSCPTLKFSKLLEPGPPHVHSAPEAGSPPPVLSPPHPASPGAAGQEPAPGRTGTGPAAGGGGDPRDTDCPSLLGPTLTRPPGHLPPKMGLEVEDLCPSEQRHLPVHSRPPWTGRGDPEAGVSLRLVSPWSVQLPVPPASPVPLGRGGSEVNMLAPRLSCPPLREPLSPLLRWATHPHTGLSGPPQRPCSGQPQWGHMGPVSRHLSSFTPGSRAGQLPSGPADQPG